MYAAHVLRNGLGTQGGLWGQGWWLLGLYSTGRRKTNKQCRCSIGANVGVRGGTELGGADRSLIMGRDRVDKRKQQETSGKINWDLARKHAELLKTSGPAGPGCKLQEKSLALVVQPLIVAPENAHVYTTLSLYAIYRQYRSVKSPLDTWWPKSWLSSFLQTRFGSPCLCS